MRQVLVLVVLVAACTPSPPPASAQIDGPAPAAAAVAVSDAPDLPARLAGRVTYPSEELPVMRVCALDSSDPGRAVCTVTASGQADFSLALPPGDWWLLAWPRDTGTAGDPGRVSAASACLARLEAGCDDHALLAITLAPGESRDGVEINDWYYDPATFPPPMEPRDDGTE